MLVGILDEIPHGGHGRAEDHRLKDRPEKTNVVPTISRDQVPHHESAQDPPLTGKGCYHLVWLVLGIRSRTPVMMSHVISIRIKFIAKIDKTFSLLSGIMDFSGRLGPVMSSRYNCCLRASTRAVSREVMA